MADMFDVQSKRGSIWHRWDPHIHTPGTALNDQYVGPNPWAAFLDAIEASNPPIRAMGRHLPAGRHHSRDSRSSVPSRRSENGAVSRQHLGGLNQTLAQQDVEVAVHVDRRIPQLGSLTLCGRHDRGRVQVQ